MSADRHAVTSCAPALPATPKRTKQPPSGAAGRPGTCCAPTCSPPTSSPPTRCPRSDDPRPPRLCQKHCTTHVVSELVAATGNDEQQRRSDWPERDRAIILTALLAGLRSEELINSNIGDLRRTADGAVIHVRGKGNKDRRIPIEAALVDVIEHYLDSRHHRLPTTAKPPLPHRGTGHLATERTAVRRHTGRAHYARNLAVPRPARLQESRHRRPTSPRGAGARAASHVRHRARQLRGQRLRLDESAWARIDVDLTTLCHCSRFGESASRSAEPPLRNLGELPSRYRSG